MELSINHKAELISREFQKTFSNMSIVILSLDVSYPEIILNYNSAAENKINATYQSAAYQFIEYAITNLRKSAIDNYPSFPYEAVMKYTVTLNEACLLSTYYDQYQYAGGAHGSTLRFSNNWNLLTGEAIELQDLFTQGEDFRRNIINQILHLADQQISQNSFIYYEDYRDLITKYFNPKNFYLTPTGILIYYQQYEIGPYASRILEFYIPYKNLEITNLGCVLYI